jgi:hypothetical protein
VSPPQADAPSSSPPSEEHHELLRVFDAHGFRLNVFLHEMLNEHHTHRTERRGAGYTQASRHLAEHVNRGRHPYEYDEARLFADRTPDSVHTLVDAAGAKGVDLPWRNLDRRAPPLGVLEDPELLIGYDEEAERQRRLRALPTLVEREESRLLAGIIVDLLLSNTAAETGYPELPPWPEKLPIGTCPLAEKYFLELAQGFVRRKGLMNVVVSEEGEPLLVEKLNLGDDHSCISVTTLLLNGVRLPRGSLFGVTYKGDVGIRKNANLAGQVIPLSRCDGFRFLRLTTLAVSPANRKRAFTTHFEAQVAGGLFEPGVATIEQIERLTREQLGENRR